MYKTDLSHSFPIRAYTKELPGAGGFADLIKVNFSGINTGQQAAVDKSIKRFIKELSGKNDSKNRIGGTVASSIYLMMQGVQILRIHDVNELQQAIKVFKKLLEN